MPQGQKNENHRQRFEVQGRETIKMSSDLELPTILRVDNGMEAQVMIQVIQETR